MSEIDFGCVPTRQSGTPAVIIRAVAEARSADRESVMKQLFG